MADLHVTCVDPRDKVRHGDITRLGGLGWSKTRQEVIDDITSGRNSFYTTYGGTISVVTVVQANPPYVRAGADGFPNDNLLRLPGC